MLRHRCVLALVALGMTAGAAAAAQPETPVRQAQDLKALSLEELLQIDVTSVSRSSERRVEAPAAISVITGEDIRRYGVSTLADALRLADSVTVARFNTGSWGISTRGFTAITNNKLLVLIDGRSVYTQMFGGVFWEAQDVMLPDLDRIEIIRGPAGTLWGPNAVNGVINIITKPATATEGVLVQANAGNRERHHVALRYGKRLTANTAARVYFLSGAFDSPQLQNGASVREDRSTQQAGFRFDWESPSPQQTHLTIQGDASLGAMQLSDRPDSQMQSANLVATLTRQLSPRSSFQLLGYVDNAHREVPRQSWDTRTTYNIEGQHESRTASRFRFVWGGGARTTQDRTRESTILFFAPDDRTINQLHGYVQGDVNLRPDVTLTLGTRGERSTFSTFELQPSVRARYTPGNRATLWGAVSRASRTPTRFDQDLRVRVGNIVVIQGDPDFKSEHLLAYEAGARVMTTATMSIEATFFHHAYDDLRSQEPTLPAGFPIVLANLYEGRTRGVEIAANAQPFSRWLLHASYTGQRIDLTPQPGSRDTTNARAEAEDPSQMMSLRSYVNLPGDVEVDTFFRAVGKLRVSNVPAYREMDMRVGFRLRSDLDFSIVGRDLLHPRHPELAGGGGQLRYFQREVLARLTWQRR